jgi:outer membrane protein assembly factor BamB
MQNQHVESRTRFSRNGKAALIPVILILVVGIVLAACAGVSTTPTGNPASVNVPSSAIFLLRGDVPGNNEETSVVRLSLQTGQRLWVHLPDPIVRGAVAGSPVLQPTLQGGLIIVPDNYIDPSDRTYFSQMETLDPATGHVRWRQKIAPSQGIDGGIYNEPVVENGVMYITSSVFASMAQPQPQWTLVEALDIRNGAVLWSKTLSGFPNAPFVADEHVILLADNGLVALTTSNGSIAWTFIPTAGSYTYTALDGGSLNKEDYTVNEGDPGPVTANHLIFVEATAGQDLTGLGSQWFAVRTTTGKLAWQSARSARGLVYTWPTLDQRGDILCTSAWGEGLGNLVIGFSTATGKVVWNHQSSNQLSVCAAAGNTFYVTDSDENHTSGGILALNSANGQELWQRATAIPPVVAPGVVAPPESDGLAAVFSPPPDTPGFTSTTSSITVVQLSNGKRLWQHDIKACLTMPETVIGNLLLVPQYSLAYTSLLVAYSLHTGDTIWAYHLGHRC